MRKQAQATRDIPVIMVSAVYRGKKISEDIRIQHGANAHLEKPLRLARFLLAETYEKAGFIQKAKEAWQDFCGHCSDEKKRSQVQHHISQIANWSHVDKP